MLTIQQYCNWCQYDTYGKPNHEGSNRPSNMVENGDQIEVMWPNGLISEHTVHVREYNERGSDHGHEISIPCRTSHIEVDLHGVKVVIPLYKSGIRVRKI